MVLRSINSAIASAGIRTARPQFTRGSFRSTSHALTVEILTFNASAASATVSKFFMYPSVAHNVISRARIRKIGTAGCVAPCAVRWVFEWKDGYLLDVHAESTPTFAGLYKRPFRIRVALESVLPSAALLFEPF